MDELKHSDKWSTSYDGIGIEISKHSIGEKVAWCYYLFLHIDRIPKESKPNSFWLRPRKDRNHTFYDYWKHPVLGQFFLSGGITWYSKESASGEARVIKVGCDYSHIWNDEHYYDENVLLEDAKKSIDSFRTHVPRYKYWCNGNGKIYDRSEGIFHNNHFKSKEYYGKEKWFKKLFKEQKLVTV